MSIEIPKPEGLLQLGYDMGLQYVEEAYNSMMGHYDLFFSIEKINEQLEAFHKSLEAVGLGKLASNRNMMMFGEMTILEAATKIKYTLTEMPDLPPDDTDEELDLDGLSSEDMLMADPLDSVRLNNEEDPEDFL